MRLKGKFLNICQVQLKIIYRLYLFMHTGTQRTVKISENYF